MKTPCATVLSAAFAFLCAGAAAEPFPADAGRGLGYRIRFVGSYKERENALVFSFITDGDAQADDESALSFKLPGKPLKITITDTTISPAANSGDEASSRPLD